MKVKISGKASPDNLYPLSVKFDAGKDGIAAHWEDMHVNYIEKRTITVDGKLDDWEGALPQVVKSSDGASLSVTEAVGILLRSLKNQFRVLYCLFSV